MLITFEGLDGSGKTTQINLTKEYLESKGFSIVMIREPGGTQVGEEIRNLLLNKEFNLSDRAELFLFEAARAEICSKVIIPALEQGKIVLCDRFFDSTTAYQSYGRKFPIDFTNINNSFASYNLIPDITFYLKVDSNARKQRISDKIKDRMEELDDSFFEDVETGFESLALNEARIKKIDTSIGIDNVFEIIKKEIDNILIKRKEQNV